MFGTPPPQQVVELATSYEQGCFGDEDYIELDEDADLISTILGTWFDQFVSVMRCVSFEFEFPVEAERRLGFYGNHPLHFGVNFNYYPSDPATGDITAPCPTALCRLDVSGMLSVRSG